jgi:hypothetical protein
MVKHVRSKMSQPDNHTIAKELKGLLSNYPTKADLKADLDATKAELKADIAASEQRLQQRLEHNLSVEFTRQENALLVESRRLMGVVDEKYNDIPVRVTDLEKAVGIER